MRYRQAVTKVSENVTINVSAFRISEPPKDDVLGPHEWLAVATASVFDAVPEESRGSLSPEQAVLAGTVMRVVTGRASANNRKDALCSAVHALLFQMDASGY